MSEVSLRVYKKFSKTDAKANYYILDVDNSKTDFKLDLSVSENQDLGAIYGIGSQQFYLPPTKQNIQFFEYIEDVGSLGGNEAFQNIFDAQVIVDGIRVATGKLWFNRVINNVQSINCQCTFTDSIPALNTMFEDVKLGDLNWLSFDHAYSLANLTGSWDNSGTFPLDGTIKYPSAFYGYEDGDDYLYEFGVALDVSGTIRNPQSPLPIDNFKPSIRLKNIFNQIFEGQSVSYTSSFIEGDTTFGTTTKTLDDVYMLLPTYEGKGVNDIVPNKTILDADTNPFAFAEININEANLSGYTTEVMDTNNSWNPTTGIFTAQGSGTYQFSIELAFDTMFFSHSDLKKQFELVYKLNGGDNINIDDIGNDWDSGTSQTFSTSWSISLTDGDEIEIIFLVNFVVSSALETTNGNLGAKLEIENSGQGSPNSVFMEEQFGDISVLDFIQGVSHMFNLVMWTEYDSPNVIRFEPYNDYLNLGTSKDWSNKVDKSMGIELFHPAHEQSKQVDFGYKQGKDFSSEYVQERYNGEDRGYYGYKTTNEYSTGIKDNKNKLFGPTAMKPLKSGTTDVISNKRMTIPHIHKGAGIESKPLEFSPRLLFDNGEQILSSSSGLAYNYYIKDFLGSQAQTNVYLQMSPFTNMVGGSDNFYLGFTSNDYWHDSNVITEYNSGGVQNLYNEFYARQYNQLYRPGARKMICNIKFTPLDITTFKLNDEILIDGHVWIINKVSGFNLLKDDSVKVEFIKKLQPIHQPVFTLGGSSVIQKPSAGDYPAGFEAGDEIIFVDDSSDPSEYAVKAVKHDDTSITISPSGVPSSITGQLGIMLGSGSLQLYNNYTKGRIGQQAASTTPLSIGGSVLNNNFPPTALVQGFNNTIPQTATNILILGDDNTVGNSNSNNIVLGNSNILNSSNSNIVVIGDTNTLGINGDNSLVLGEETVVNTVELSTLINASGSNESNFQASIILGDYYNKSPLNAGLVVDNIFASNKKCKFVGTPGWGDWAGITYIQDLGVIGNYNLNIDEFSMGVIMGSKPTGSVILGNGNDSTPYNGDIISHPSKAISSKNLFGCFTSGDFDISVIDSTGIGCNNIIGTVNFGDYSWAPSATTKFANTTFIGKSHHTGGKFTNYKKYTCSAGSSGAIDENQNVIFLTWTGGNGTHSFLVPDSAAVDGQILEIKCDNSITSVRNVTLTGPVGNTFDGALSYNLNSNYAFVKLIAMDGDWYVC